MEAIKKYVSDNLPELAAEVIELKSTGILKKGLMRELANMIESYLPDFDGMKIAESMINRAAQEYVVRHHEGVE